MNPARTSSAKTADGPAYRPHDLLWIDGFAGFVSGSPLPAWVGEQWHTGLPVVVRRDFSEQGLIPVGIRGKKRSERAAAWLSPDRVRQLLAPESLVSDREKLATSPFAATKPVRAILALAELKLPWVWGVTGSCAYALATGNSVMHADSDLDILIRCPEPAHRAAFAGLAGMLDTLPCRTDVQIETPSGAFALQEWLRNSPVTGDSGEGGRVLLKTNFGPVMSADPWQSDRPAEREMP